MSLTINELISELEKHSVCQYCKSEYEKGDNSEECKNCGGPRYKMDWKETGDK